LFVLNNYKIIFMYLNILHLYKATIISLKQ